jgi:hypothetical protein
MILVRRQRMRALVGSKAPPPPCGLAESTSDGRAEAEPRSAMILPEWRAPARILVGPGRLPAIFERASGTDAAVSHWPFEPVPAFGPAGRARALGELLRTLCEDPREPATGRRALGPFPVASHVQTGKLPMTVFGIVFFSVLNLAMMIVNAWIARRMETAARDMQTGAQTNMLIMSLIDELRGQPPMPLTGEPGRPSRLQ